jgi:hypothetical protein
MREHSQNLNLSNGSDENSNAIALLLPIRAASHREIINKISSAPWSSKPLYGTPSTLLPFL